MRPHPAAEVILVHACFAKAMAENSAPSAEINAPVFFPDGATVVGGPDFVVQLYVSLRLLESHMEQQKNDMANADTANVAVVLTTPASSHPPR
jgi:hypothetical protein